MDNEIYIIGGAITAATLLDPRLGQEGWQRRPGDYHRGRRLRRSI